MQTCTRLLLPRLAAAAAVNAKVTMDDRGRSPGSIRARNAARLRASLQPAKRVPFLTVPRIIGGVILLLALLLIAIGAVTA